MSCETDCPCGNPQWFEPRFFGGKKQRVAPYVFVIPCPRETDFQSGELYSGGAFDRIKRILTIMGADLNDFALVSMTKCRRASGKPHLKDYKCCKLDFQLTLSGLGPKKVFTLGAAPWNVLGDGSRFYQSKLRSVPLMWMGEPMAGDVMVSALLDPATAGADPVRATQFAQDLDSLLRPAGGREIRWVWQDTPPKSLLRAPVVILDIESHGLELGADIVMVGYKLPQWKSVKVSPLKGNEEFWSNMLLRLDLTIVGHNVKFDISRLAHALQISRINCQAKCSMVQHFVYSEDMTARSLDRLSKVYTDLIEFKDDSRTLWEAGEDVPFKVLAERNAYDVEATQIVYDKITEDLVESGEYSPALDWHYGQVIPMVSWMEQVGVSLDHVELKKQRAAHRGQQTKYRNLIEEIAPNLNPGSTLQVAEVVYNYHDIEPVVLTEKGKPSTSEEALHAVLDERDPPQKIQTFIQHLLDWRKHTKILSGYLDKLSEEGDIVYPDFYLVRGGGSMMEDVGGTVTGRLAVKRPALQTIANGDLRKIFNSRWKKGNLWCIDAEQMELKVLADLSKCQALLDVFNSGGDLHQWTADLCGTTRKAGKTINFGSVYGCSEKKLVVLGLSEKVAHRAREVLEQEWADLYSYMDGVEWEAADTGQVSTPYGARRRLPLAHQKGKIGQAARRQAANFIAQRPGSDLVQLLGAMLQQVGDRDTFTPILTVHDEIIVDSCMSHEKTLGTIRMVIDGWRQHVASGLGWCPEVPMGWEITKGPNWGEQEVVEVRTV